MDSLVLIQVSHGIETHATSGAGVGLFSSVDPHVFRQCFRVLKALATNTTMIGILVRVDSLVSGQIKRLSKRDSARST